MFEKLSKKFTNNYQEIPLFYVTFNLQKYLKQGEKGSCDLKLHPSFRDDQFIIENLNKMVDHIRDNYDMEEIK